MPIINKVKSTTATNRLLAIARSIRYNTNVFRFGAHSANFNTNNSTANTEFRPSSNKIASFQLSSKLIHSQGHTHNATVIVYMSVFRQ